MTRSLRYTRLFLKGEFHSKTLIHRDFKTTRLLNQWALVVGIALLMVVGIGGAGQLQAQSKTNWLGGLHRRAAIASRDSGAMMRLLRPLSESVEQSIVQVFSGSRIVSLGTVVSEDGYVLTKHSELSADPISVRLPSGKKVSARLSSVRRSNDLALLKIDGKDPSSWKIGPAKFVTDEPQTGSFLISPDRGGFTIGIGVLGVQSRQIGHQGRLGVRFLDAPTGPATVQDVFPESGAEDAGVRDGDQVLKINGREMFGSRSAINLLNQMYPGEVVRLTIVRGDDTIEVNAKMSDEAILRESKNDAKVNGPRNRRLSGFDSVFQHDTVLAPNHCGGPVLDSSGRVVGINIARAGRVVSYALPAALVNAELISMLEEARRRDQS